MLHWCCVFYKLEAKHSISKKIRTHSFATLAVLRHLLYYSGLNLNCSISGVSVLLWWYSAPIFGKEKVRVREAGLGERKACYSFLKKKFAFCILKIEFLVKFASVHINK